MRRRKISAFKRFGCGFSAVILLFTACKHIDEEPPEQIYYIAASETFMMQETTFPDEAAETVLETELFSEISETETETESETESETTLEAPETTVITEAETTEETFTETEPETVSETSVTAETVSETVTETEMVSETVAENTVSETETAQTEPAALYDMTFPAEDTYVKPLGRTFMEDGVRILSHTCSGVEFAFRGTSADVTLTSNCKTSKARAAFYVNGEYTFDTMLENKEETFHLFDSEIPKNCIISVVKLSEAAYSNIGVKSIRVNSEYGIIPTPERKRKIEFIGDSITCGYGVDAANQYEAFATSNENGEKTYAALIGKHFKADYNVISWSGMGVYSSYTEKSTPNQGSLMPSVYDKTAPNDKYGDVWDFTQWQPDLIVINLGTNDNTWTKGIQERVDLFGAAYYDFIVQVRKHNPNAYIICSLGAMGSKLLPEIKEQIGLYSANTGDNRITSFEFDYRDGVNDGFGAGFHPSAVTHQKMADKIIPFISEIMGWE